jgi:hypothetical protein
VIRLAIVEASHPPWCACLQLARIFFADRGDVLARQLQQCDCLDLKPGRPPVLSANETRFIAPVAAGNASLARPRWPSVDASAAKEWWGASAWARPCRILPGSGARLGTVKMRASPGRRSEGYSPCLRGEVCGRGTLASGGMNAEKANVIFS